MRKKLLKLSGISAIISVLIFAFNFYFFHFVTDEGISLTWQPEPGKPFVTDLIGLLAVLFIFASAMCLLITHIFYPRENK